MCKHKEHNCIGKDELLDKTKTNIAKYGLQVITVSGSNYLPSFAYSIGLFETYQQPEIICFGLPTELGHAIINDVAALMKNGEAIKAYTNYDNIFNSGKAEFLPVDERNIDDYFGAALNYYTTTTFPALQLVWTDRNKRFPWEDDFEETFLYDQPLLDRNAAFKFREAKDLGIFTTRQWLELDQPILTVFHDSDGEWQFLTGDQMPEDIRLVALEQMVLRDPTLNAAFNLDYGYTLDREFVGGEWTRTKLEDE
ncbi:MAG: DUF4262 domain-containing protein [Niastella sp.]|nr:DUF4262 domain-containing protein [Niastella sp.]